MTPEEHLAQGNLADTLSTLQDKVRAAPQDAKLRIFLFQLLCVLGDWKRAITQLKVAAELDDNATTMAQTYREAIRCEVYREKVFVGEKDPLIFGEPEEWLAHLAEALKLQAKGHVAEAAELRGKAFEAASTEAGTLNGDAFEWIADADMRLGPVLEVILNGKYFWMPFTAIHTMTIEPPADLRDSVWMPAILGLRTGADLVALIPTRYPGTTEGEDTAAKLARKTEWADVGADTFVGTGQRLLATEAGDTALMDVRLLEIGPPVAASEAEAASDG